MKFSIFLIGFSILLFSYLNAPLLATNFEATQCFKTSSADSASVWHLIFSDEFNTTGKFDPSKWKYSPRAHPAWAKYLTPSPKYVSQNGKGLLLKMDNAVINGDPAPYHSGGIQTATKFSFLYGKVEVRAKFNHGQGSWPAIWMMPETPVAYGDWPNSGEVDIMEHVNFENVIHHTIHCGTATDKEGGSTATKSAAYNTADYNIYGIVWEPTEIKFYVNNILQYTYAKKVNATPAQWPFDKPFYIILNQSGGAGWPGEIKNTDLPFQMKIDWIRVYQEKAIPVGT